MAKSGPSSVRRLLNLAAHRKRQKVDILTPESTSGSVADPTQASLDVGLLFPKLKLAGREGGRIVRNSFGVMGKSTR